MTVAALSCMFLLAVMPFACFAFLLALHAFLCFACCQSVCTALHSFVVQHCTACFRSPFAPSVLVVVVGSCPPLFTLLVVLVDFVVTRRRVVLVVVVVVVVVEITSDKKA